MTFMQLNTYLKPDIFSVLSRRDLCRLREINRYFRNFIDNELGDGRPYLVFGEFYYRSHLNYWSKYNRHDPNFEHTVISQLPIPAYIRFQRTFIDCLELIAGVDIISVSHFWEEYYLWIDWKNFVITVDHARSFANAKELHVYSSSGLLKFLPQLISGKCKTICLKDITFDPDKITISWENISDFLFRDTEMLDENHRLSISTKRCPNNEECIQFIEAVKKRFEAAKFPVNFNFCWDADEDQKTEYPSYDICNEHGILEIRGYHRCFCLSTK